MPLIYEEGNVEGHVFFDDDIPQVRCFDKRRGFLEVQVIIGLLLLLPDNYGEDTTDFPTPEFVIEAMQSVLRHSGELWTA